MKRGQVRPRLDFVSRAGPRLLPEESTQRAAQIAVDMCVMNTQYMNTLSQFMSFEELFHVQMQLLYGLVDTMGATANVSPRAVIGMVDKYFKQLDMERKKIRESDEKDK